jgi:hypothetical protein
MVPPKTCREKRKHAIVVHVRRNRWAHRKSEASIGEGCLLRTGGIRHVSPQESTVVSARRSLVKGLRKAGRKARGCVEVHRRCPIRTANDLHANDRNGSFVSVWPRTDDFRSTAINRHRYRASSCLKSAKNRHGHQAQYLQQDRRFGVAAIIRVSLEPFSFGSRPSKHLPRSSLIHQSFEDRSRDRHNSRRRSSPLPHTGL